MGKRDNQTILVIDSDPISMTATAAVLHASDFRVFCAQDQSAAICAARQQSLDLILCDLDVDNTPGECIIARIRQLPEGVDVPVMYASSCQLPEVIRKGQGAEAAYHLRKPFDPHVLLELLDFALWIPPRVRSHHIRPPQFVPRNSPAIDWTPTTLS